MQILGFSAGLQLLRGRLRKAIRDSFKDLQLKKCVIDLEKEDGKKIWEALEKEVPVFALFRADRPSTDQDAEVQDPMKIAVAEAIRTVEDQLRNIEDVVRRQATEVAVRTLEKLKEMDASLASGLVPEFRADPKWDSLFKLTLNGDDGVPVNKRGSGVRRLILLNFFRAEAERKQSERSSPGVIYAIEEPETSQHPNNQKMLVQSGVWPLCFRWRAFDMLSGMGWGRTRLLLAAMTCTAQLLSSLVSCPTVASRFCSTWKGPMTLLSSTISVRSYTKWIPPSPT